MKEEEIEDCPFPPEREKHPVFVYLISDGRYTNNKHLQEIMPYIGVAENPFDDIRRQNREKGYSGSDHSTKEGAGFLKLEMFIGPFVSAVGLQFQQEWRESARKLFSRVQKGIIQAAKYGAKVVYCADPEWAKSVLLSKKTKP